MFLLGKGCRVKRSDMACPRIDLKKDKEMKKMDELADNVIHVIIAASFIVAVSSVVAGFSSGDPNYLGVMVSSITIALLASILYVAEQILTDMTRPERAAPRSKKPAPRRRKR